MHFTPYALPAILALLIKIAMFVYARYSKVHNLQTQLFLLFLFCVAVQNLAEIQFFLLHEDGYLRASDVGSWWYGAAVLELAFLLHLTFVVGTDWRDSGENIPTVGVALIYVPAIVIEILLWSTRLLIVDFEPMSYTVTQIPGPLYFLFQLYVVGYLCLAIGLLAHGSRTLSSKFRRRQSRFLLVGLAPFVGLAVVIIVLRFLGFRGFNATATLPFTVTFLLVVTAYATHQYRLFDIEFFLPWSKVRKRKTAFYSRIQALIAEIAGMSSVQRIIHSISEALHCPVALVGGPTPSLAIAGEAFGIARFPLDELKKIDQIVVANEIAKAMPSTHALMKRHKIAAIVPFHPHSQAAASWMLLGEAFSEQVYSPLDFKTVETLFARLADNFLDNQLLLRSQLLEAQREIDTLHARLAGAWDEIDSLRRELFDAKSERQTQDPAVFGHERIASALDAEHRHDAARGSVDESVTEYEMRLIAKTMDHCGGDVSRAAELLNLPKATLSKKLQQMAEREADPAEPQVLFV
jgi:small-conductance mechanosensitive channel